MFRPKSEKAILRQSALDAEDTLAWLEEIGAPRVAIDEAYDLVETLWDRFSERYLDYMECE